MRMLITGMSGVGKSSVIEELARRGRAAVDLDAPEWSEWVDADPADRLTPVAGKDWVWRLDRVAALLADPAHDELFVGGCAENMSAVYPVFDVVVLLSAPPATIMGRLSARSPGSYGERPEDRLKVAALIETVEPLLRAGADHEIDASAPLDVVVETVLKLAHDHGSQSVGSPEVAGRRASGAAGRRRTVPIRRAPR